MRCRYFAFHPARELLARNMNAARQRADAAGDVGGSVQDARAILVFAHWPIVGGRSRLAYRALRRRGVAVRGKSPPGLATGVSLQASACSRAATRRKWGEHCSAVEVAAMRDCYEMSATPPSPAAAAAPARPAARKQSTSVAKPPKWHYLYFVLAALDLIAVCAGLYLSHSIMTIYERSVAANQTWAERVFAYSHLGELASAVNAPGNDVFDSREVDVENARMQAAREVFDAKLAVLREELRTNLTPSEAAPLLARLDNVGVAMEAMLAEARLIFSYFRAGQPERAGERMATMDRRYATVNSALADLRHSVAMVQQKNFEQQTAAASRQRDFEYLIGGLILLMVAGATFYGHRMA